MGNMYNYILSKMPSETSCLNEFKLTYRKHKNNHIFTTNDIKVKIDENNAWGSGIAIEYINETQMTYWHSGINPGFQSLFVLYPEQNKYIVILTNSDRGLDFSKEIARSFLNIDGEWDIKRE